MVPHVLGVGYAYNEYEVTAGRWKEFEIEFDYADNIKQAAAMLSFKEYICVAICSDVIPQDDLDILRQKRAVPIIVVPPSYSEEQRYACVHFGAAQYLHTSLVLARLVFSATRVKTTPSIFNFGLICFRTLPIVFVSCVIPFSGK